MKAIYKREVCAYFHAMTGWVFTAVVTAFTGIYFLSYNLSYGDPYFSTALNASLFVMLVMVPILTMRSMADERRSRTDQLLLTAPVSVGAMVWAKYLAMLTVLAVPTAIAALCPLIIRLNGTAFLAADYGTLLAFFLLGAVQIAVGEFISSLTESQSIAAVGTFAALLCLFLWEGLVSFLPVTAMGSLVGILVIALFLALGVTALTGSWKPGAAVLAVSWGAAIGVYVWDADRFAGLLPDLFGRFSLLAAFDSFAVDHVFDLSGVVLYVTLALLALFLTVQVVQKRRWS